jgi:hypothetical protein
MLPDRVAWQPKTPRLARQQNMVQDVYIPFTVHSKAQA